ncbi:MAG: hypothetical protein BWY47_01900 [Bacteroidetes bacterium ADurb.Bin302]|nr:MAG: hypothetical protein BWY47_01900 [Bacteroidetes bacterium ADurb.Bin302]
MSEYGFCPKGGQQGIKVSDKELNSFADAIGSNVLDAVIPIPNMTVEQQKIEIAHCDDHESNPEYFERNNGSHGWCCGNCGTVFQWG